VQQNVLQTKLSADQLWPPQGYLTELPFVARGCLLGGNTFTATMRGRRLYVFPFKDNAGFSYLNAPDSDAMKAPVAMLEMSYNNPC
jgi:hypothetical protein